MLSIRTSFSLEEMPVLYEIEKACFAPRFRWDRETFDKEIPKHDIWIGEVGSKIVGFLVGKVDRGMGYIISVETAPEHQGKGYGKELVLASETAFRKKGLKQCRLEVYTENPAQILYFKLGYRVNGFKRDYYAKGHHAISMIKNL